MNGKEVHNDQNNKNNTINKIISKKSKSNKNLISKKKRRKNNSMPEIIEDNNMNGINYIYDNNSISYSVKNNKSIDSNNHKNNMNESNNMSNFILLQKNTRKSFTDINILQKEIKSKDNSKNSIDNGVNPKFIIHINNKQSNNKIQINNFVNKISNNHNYFLLYHQLTKMMKKCFICDTFNKRLFHTEKCSHIFCEICGKVFYEQQINKCIYNLECPKYSCHKHLNIKVLKQFLSKFIFEKLIDNLETNSQTCDKILVNASQNINSSRERNNKKNSLFSEDKEYSIQQNKSYLYNLTYQKEFAFQDEKKSNKKIRKNDLFLKKLTKKYQSNLDKDLVNKHILKLSGSSKFFKAIRKINEFKNTFCSQCNKACLFPVRNKPFLRCLNCGFANCKFCFKKYDYFHFIRNNARACRVFFRSHIIGRRQKYIYFYQFLYILGGFFVLLIGFTKFEAKFVSNYNTNKIYILYIISFFILLFINSIIFVFFLPYYPLVLLIVEF